MISPVASIIDAFCHCLCRRCSEPSLPLSPTESPQLPLLFAVAIGVRCRCCPLPLFCCCLLSLSAASTATTAVVRSTVAAVLD
ncbi:hypothetical protein BHM03_00014810 [Ensete ventricosum]|uniref:Uncharacterized protein n=1 Tax=Ensete ventricosum TaxID=4639 RepID=A0A427AQW1_ENSVE|nr:hypothetical protein B296_00020164 [Ensete ventricosum]RZR87412.1 hypothetical protein BHM03_00014810 [Ensete ventricosum]